MGKRDRGEGSVRPPERLGVGGTGYYEVGWAQGSYMQLVNLAPGDCCRRRAFRRRTSRVTCSG